MKIKYYMEDFIRENHNVMTLREMADYLGEGVNAGDIQYWLKKNDLWTRSKKEKRFFTDEEVDFMISNYQKMEYAEIAKILNIDERQVRGKLNNLGYTKLRRFNKDYFHEIDSELKAYFVGFIFADGWVIQNPETRKYEFAMQLQSCDKYILDAINKELGGVHKISHKNPQKKIINGIETTSNHSDILRVYSKNIVQDLMRLGIVQDKTHNYQIPKIPEEFFFDFLRGYIDGDGCYYCNSKSNAMHITCASSEVLNWLQNTLESYGINSSIYKEKELKYRLVCCKKKDLCDLVNLLYHDGFSLCLSRKYNKIKHLLNGRLD